MIPPFDIFLVGSDGQLVRKGTVETLDVARLRIKVLMASERATTLFIASRQVIIYWLMRTAQLRAPEAHGHSRYFTLYFGAGRIAYHAVTFRTGSPDLISKITDELWASKTKKQPPGFSAARSRIRARAFSAFRRASSHSGPVSSRLKISYVFRPTVFASCRQSWFWQRSLKLERW